MQTRLAQGWNTWDTHSVTAQVRLPEAFTLRVGLKHNTSLNADAFLADPLIGRHGAGNEKAEQVFPGPHTWDGSYTELRLLWQGHEVRVQSAHVGDDLVMLVTPLGATARLPATVVISAGVLWNRPGTVERAGDRIVFTGGGRSIPVYCTAPDEGFTNIPLAGPYFAVPLRQPVGVSTGRARTVEEIRAVLAQRQPTGMTTAGAIETVVGWDTIYDPAHGRAVSPVSRLWNVTWGGYVLFEWDTYFAAALAAIGSRDLAYANAVEITREITPEGFVPNFARGGGWASSDRSEPPVGALTVLGLYRKFGDTWLLRDTFEPLLRWNRWWSLHRDCGGYLVWGSDAANRPGNPDDGSVGGRQGAMYESGLDNSPQFDGAPFDPATGQIRQADAGLMGLYLADCGALAEIADVLGRTAEAGELRERGARYRAKLETLWDERAGIFLNKNLETGELSPRLAPTNFYPLAAGAASAAQAERMLREHLLNPQEFWGDHVMPSIARNDPAFKDQEYWRGRIWGSMNYLVYLGLQRYAAPDVRREFTRRSRELFDAEWMAEGHVHENYNAITGDGDDVSSSDRFYHWGALLGLIDLLENAPAPQPPLPASTTR